MKTRITITLEELGKIYEEKLPKKMCGKEGWFETTEDFENWGGDVAFDMLCDFCDLVGIKIID